MATDQAAYRKIVRKTWRKKKFRNEEEMIQRFLMYMWTGPDSEMPGFYYLSIPTIADDLSTDADTVTEWLRYCIGKGWLEYDFEVRIIFFPRWDEYDPPSNANTVNSYIRKTKDLPESRLTLLYIKTLERYMIRYSVRLPEPLQVWYTERLATPIPIPSPLPSPSPIPRKKEVEHGSASKSVAPEEKTRRDDCDKIVKYLEKIDCLSGHKNLHQVAGKILKIFRAKGDDAVVATHVIREKFGYISTLKNEAAVYKVIETIDKDAVQMNKMRSEAYRQTPVTVGDHLKRL